MFAKSDAKFSMNTSHWNASLLSVLLNGKKLKMIRLIYVLMLENSLLNDEKNCLNFVFYVLDLCTGTYTLIWLTAYTDISQMRSVIMSAKIH